MLKSSQGIQSCNDILWIFFEVCDGTTLIDPIKKTDYRSFMDAEEFETHLAKLDMQLSDVYPEETIRSLENILERANKNENNP